MKIKHMIYFAILLLLSSCDQATVLNGVDHIPKDYIAGLELDSSKIKFADVFVTKAGRPVVDLLYKDRYEMVIFSCDGSKRGRLQDFLSFENSGDIETSPNTTYAGTLNYVEVRFSIRYNYLIKDPLALVTQQSSSIRTMPLNDSTTFTLLKDSRGFKLQSLDKNYAGIVVNVQENYITGFDGKADLGIFIYQRQKRDYLVVVSPKSEGVPIHLEELFHTLNMQKSDLEN